MGKKKAKNDTRNIKLPDRKRLWALSGNRCALCRIEISLKGEDESIVLGEEAHIEAHSSGGPRYNPELENPDCYDNIILLCPTCHTRIDKDPKSFPTEKLKEIKRKHEEWVSKSVKAHVNQISFAELKLITEYLVETHKPFENSEPQLSLLQLQAKIKKNSLSMQTIDIIKTGLLRVNLVREYLNQHPDKNFSKKLQARFKEEYLKLKEQGLSGDDIFNALFEFTKQDNFDFKYQMAAIAILVYFFEECEVLEK